jgi:hypothetical protein
MPASARLPSGTRVLVLCGQPLQNHGARSPVSAFSAASCASRAATTARRWSMRAAMSALTPSFFSRCAMALAMMAGVRSALARSSQFWLGLGMLHSPPVPSPPGLRRTCPARAGARRPPVVELFLELVFDDLALFFHHQDLLQPLGKVARDGGFQRPHHVDLVQPQPDGAAGVVVQPQVGQRLARVVVGLAAGDDAEAVVPPRSRCG